MPNAKKSLKAPKAAPTRQKRADQVDLTESEKIDHYLAVYERLFSPAHSALAGVALGSREYYAVSGLLAEVAGRAADEIAFGRIQS